MDYRFSVDLSALEHAAAGVGEVVDGAAEINLTQLPVGADVTGNGALADVLGDFCSRWQRGVQDLASEGRQIASRLDYAVQAYTAYERATQHAAAEGGPAPGGTVSGGSPDPGVAG